MRKSIYLRVRRREIPGRHGRLHDHRGCQTGEDIVHLREQALHTLPDDQILHKAELEGRVVLTFDLDFGELLAAGAATRPSVIIFRLRNQTPGSVTPKLVQIIGECRLDLESGAIVIVEDERYRIRRLPIRRTT